MFSQLAKQSHQKWTAVFVRVNIFNRHSDQLIWNCFQSLCVFCQAKVSGEQLISHGTYCQFHAREYSMKTALMKTILFSHCLGCCSGEWISCELYRSHVSLVLIFLENRSVTNISKLSARIIDNST